MSNLNEDEFATLHRLLRQFETQQVLPQPSTRPATSEAQHPLTQSLSPTRPRHHPYPQPPRSFPEFSTLFRDIDEIKRVQGEIKRGQDDIKRREDAILAAVNGVQITAEKIMTTVEENMERIRMNIDRFATIGRAILGLALQPSNSDPLNGSPSQPQTSANPPPLNASQQQTSNLPRPYSQTPQTINPPSQPVYVPPPQAEQYPVEYEYNTLDFLSGDS